MEHKLLFLEYQTSTEAKLEEAKIREEKLIKSNEKFKVALMQKQEETNQMVKKMMDMMSKQANP